MTPEFTFLKNNAHTEGFILRYLKGKEGITGYFYEPWHFRYVGKKAAFTIYYEGLTLEEYLARYIEIPPID
jgi:D-alanyl-D-alanine carboxypeptidase